MHKNITGVHQGVYNTRVGEGVYNMVQQQEEAELALGVVGVIKPANCIVVAVGAVAVAVGGWCDQASQLVSCSSCSYLSWHPTSTSPHHHTLLLPVFDDHSFSATFEKTQ